MNDILDSQNSFGDLFKWHEELQRKLNPLKDIIDSSNYLVKSITPNIDFGNNIFDSALYQYGLELQSIIEKFNNPVLSSFNNIQELANEFIEEKQKAESNLYHKLTVEEHEAEKQQYTQQNAELEQRNIELEQQIKRLEIATQELACLIAKSVPQQKREQSNKNTSIKNKLTPSQIIRLSNELANIFVATLEQWQSLFSENIELKAPIIVRGFKSDVKVLFHYLQLKDLVETSKYPSKLEKTKAFSFENEIMTAKKINATTGSDNFPNMGNYIKIQSVIENL